MLTQEARQSVTANVGANVGLIMGMFVGTGVGNLVGTLLGEAVGGAVGPLDGVNVEGTGVGLLVGVRVGDGVGAVGTAVGVLVGDAVGAAVGVLVGDAVDAGGGRKETAKINLPKHKTQRKKRGYHKSRISIEGVLYTCNVDVADGASGGRVRSIRVGSQEVVGLAHGGHLRRGDWVTVVIAGVLGSPRHKVGPIEREHAGRVGGCIAGHELRTIFVIHHVVVPGLQVGRCGDANLD